MFAWTAWEVILPVMVGILGFTLFMVWSTQSGKEAILPKTMFKRPTALASYFGATVFGMVLWCSLLYMVSNCLSLSLSKSPWSPPSMVIIVVTRGIMLPCHVMCHLSTVPYFLFSLSYISLINQYHDLLQQ